MVLTLSASLKRARKDALEISTEEDAVKSLNSSLKELKCYSGTNHEDGFNLLTVPISINSIITKSSGDGKQFIRTVLMNQLIFQNIFLFYSRLSKYENDFENELIERAIIWMGDCMMEMIGNSDQFLHIASLDALLTSIGEYDTLEFNKLKSKLMIGTLKYFNSSSFSSQDSAESLDEIFRLQRNMFNQNGEVNCMDQPLLSNQMQIFFEESESLLHLLE